jgi:GTP cyclohydrolase I
MTDAYIFIGSNIERDKNLPDAVRRLRALGKVSAVSPVYDTPAQGGEGSAPRFYNAAVRLDTGLAPHALRNRLRHIEREMGRVRTGDPNAPRTIDLDLVLFGEAMIDDGELQIPDPHIFEWGFMARALAHVNPDYVIPPDGPTLAELACRVRGKPGEIWEVPQQSAEARASARKSVKEPRSMSEHEGFNARRVGEDEWGRPMPEMDSHHAFGDAGVDTEKLPAREAIADAVRTILVNVGEDPEREGLLKTPERVARAYEELLAGYEQDPVALINDAFFDTEYHDMVVVKDIEFFSMCEHHMLPFFGTVHVAYIPEGKVLGLSKIPRIVDMYARRLQLQEKMTHEIADFIQDLLNPRGVAVIVTGQHMCSMMRGVNKPDAKMVTQVMYGAFQDPEMRDQLNDHLRAGN